MLKPYETNFLPQDNDERLIETPDILKSLPDNIADEKHLRSNQVMLFSYIDRNKHRCMNKIGSKEAIEALLELHYQPTKMGNYHFFYDSLPSSDIFRLFVDVNKQRKPYEQGFVMYEKREPGCIQSMYDAFVYMMDSLTEPLTVGYIKKIHEIAAKPIPDFVSDLFSRSENISIYPGQFKDSESGLITMGQSQITPLGFKDMMVGFRVTSHYMLDEHFVIYLGYPKNGYDHEVHKLICQYEENIDKKTPLEKLKTIVALAQGLNRTHPFHDGNVRVFVTLLMNRELVKHGFTPALMDDPNRLDGYSLDESIYQVLLGMQNFKALVTTGHIQGCIPTEDILSAGAEYPIKFRSKKHKVI